MTPEEKVRQEVINYLLHASQYPRGNISVEKQLVVNGLQRRYDVLVYNKSFAPSLLVECKSPGITLDEKTSRQIAMYNLSLQVPYLWLTNGNTHFIIRMELAKGAYVYLDSLPVFSEL